MSGRYRLSRRKEILAEHFDADLSDFEAWQPRYNIAPTQTVPVVRQHPKEPVRVLSMMRWGLTPLWAKDISGAARMINTISESDDVARFSRADEILPSERPAKFSRLFGLPEVRLLATN